MMKCIINSPDNTVNLLLHCIEVLRQNFEYNNRGVSTNI